MNCQVDKCSGKAEFAEVGKDICRCKHHAIKGDTRNPFESCTYQTCLNPATYTHKPDALPQRCEQHKTEEDFSVLLHHCPQCKTIFMPLGAKLAICRSCIDQIDTHINEFLAPHRQFILDKTKNQIRLSASQDSAMVIVQFVQQEKAGKGKDKDPFNTAQLTDTSRTIKRPIILILCNLANYNTGSKKQQPLTIPERLTTAQGILASALQSKPDRDLTVKRLFYDHYA